MRVALIKWCDAKWVGGWNSADEFEALQLVDVEAVGFILKETDEEVCLIQANSKNEDNMHGALLIPRGCIYSIEILKDDNINVNGK